MTECVFAAVFTGAIFLMIQDDPAPWGLSPYRDDSSGQNAIQVRRPQGAMPPAETLLIMAAVFLLGGVNASSTSHLAIHYAAVGYPAALAFAVFGIVLIPGKFFYGILADRLGAYHANYIFLCASVAAGLTTAVLQADSNFLLFLSAFLQGLGVPVGTVGVSIWILDLSSERTFLKNLQLSQSAYAVGGLAISLLTGLIADRTGSFSPAFVFCGLMTLTATVIVQAIYRRHLGRFPTPSA